MFQETVGNLPLKDLKCRFKYLKSLFNHNGVDINNVQGLQTGMGGSS